LHFEQQFLNAVDRRTTVIILGDGRTNYQATGADVVAEMRARARSVLWLCPEPRRRWWWRRARIWKEQRASSSCARRRVPRARIASSQRIEAVAPDHARASATTLEPRFYSSS
jgi:hypothetical protein